MVEYLISHRGNIDGPKPELENSIGYIEAALKLGYEVEIDIWYIKGKFWLGHDEPQYEVKESWLFDRAERLWIHCKNVEAMVWFNKILTFNFFFHNKDDAVLTSKQKIWAYPGKQPIQDSIAVLPEINNDDVCACIGICSDYIRRYDNSTRRIK